MDATPRVAAGGEIPASVSLGTALTPLNRRAQTWSMEVQAQVERGT